MRAFDLFPFDHSSFTRPRERYEVCPRPRTSRYDIPGEWEPVQRSAQRVYPSGDVFPASRLHRAFSGLNFDDDFDVDRQLEDRHFLPNGYTNQRPEISGLRNYPETYSRTNNGKFSKPLKRVVHNSKDRMIQIPVEHVITIPDDPYLDLNRNAYIDRLSPDHVRKSRDYIDLSDEVSEGSLSDQSDCEIYPFVSGNTNNNVRTRRSASTRSEPYPKDHRRKSPSPDRDFVVASPSSSPRSRRRFQDTVHLTERNNEEWNGRKEENRLAEASPYSRFCEDDTLRLGGSSFSRGSSNLASGSLPRRSLRNRSQDRYSLIEDDKDSAFSINQAYKFSDEENGIRDYKDSKTDRKTKKEIMKNESSSDSEEGITATPSYPAYNIIRDMIEPEGRQVDYIRGDGNCFFRALSKVIYNTESCHEEIRQAVVDLMEKYPKDFEQFIDGKSLQYHIKSMRKTGTWGTQAEIYGAATLLQRDIYILSPDPTGKRYRWLLFSPRFTQTELNCFDLCYITLCHTNGNHYDRIAPLVGKCNCALLPPQLAGVKEQVDLTTTESEEDLWIV